MKVLIAPDKFKDCLSAVEVCQSIAAGLRDAAASIELDQCPMADGGEGTVTALVAATRGRILTHRVTGPLPEMKVDAAFGILGDGVTAVIEMSAASGLALLRPDDRNPLNTTTFGTGELLSTAVKAGAKRIILGIGGSATTDGGIGCAQACGFTVLMRDGTQATLTEPICGRDLDSVLMVKHGRGEITNGIDITVACDVSNPLYGDRGSARIFSPQKGASPTDVEWLDRALRELALRTGTDEYAHRPGAGAAGGLGFGMMAFFGAKLQSGADMVADAVNLRQRLKGVDLCITGEGRLDESSTDGKTAVGVARICRQMNVPCIALVGSIGPGAERALQEGLTSYFSVCDRPMTLPQAVADAPRLLRESAANCARLWTVAKPR